MGNKWMKQAEALFGELADLPTVQRAPILEQRCADNERLKSWVEHLLAIDDSDAQGLLHRPICPVACNDELVPEESPPARIGRYETLRKIGEGGMGVVYEARQRNPNRSVALKLIRSSWPSRNMLRRFQRESEILGHLQHPGIAQIYEADTAEVATSAGAQLRQPFFAMEYIRGKPLDRHARDSNLGASQRLKLLATVCDAVQYAHQKGVIHRDLKPGNILVDETGQPKILDFGVACAANADVESLTMHTDAGQLIGTLSYMSPEMVVGDDRKVDTRSDVYSLGVILYELLCGKRPLDVSGKSIPEAARIIRDETPAPISSVARNLRGDVQTICIKALEKDPDRRYQSARDLAEDIRRQLRGEPIEAQRDSALYMLRKTVRRYRWPVAALCLLVVMLAAFGVYALVQARNYRALALREVQAKQQAETAAARADAVKGFLQDMLAAADPRRAGGRNVTVREVLDDASKQIAAGLLADEPAVEAEVRATIAHTYFNLGMNNAAIPHYQWVCDYRERAFGAGAEETIDALCWLGLAHVEGPSPEPALPIYERALDLALDSLGPDHETTLRTMDGLGAALTRIRRADEAEAYHLDALDGVQRLYGDEHELFVSASLHLGQIYTKQCKLDEAERLYIKALDAAEHLHGSASRVSIRLRWRLASEIYARTERLALAEAMLAEALTDARSALGPEHTETMIVLTRLSRVLVQSGRDDEAEKLLRDAIADLSEIRAGEGNDTIKAVGELAHLLRRRGDLDEAVSLLRDGLDRARDLPGHHPLVLASWLGALADWECERRDFAAAVEATRETLEIYESRFGPQHKNVARSLQRLAWYLHQLGGFDEAVPLFERALAMRRRLLGETHHETLRTRVTLSYSYLLMGEPDRGVLILHQGYQDVLDEVGEEHPEAAYVAGYLSQLLSNAGRDAEAATLCRERLQLAQATEPINHRDIGHWQLRLGRSLYLGADFAGAIEACRRADAEYQLAEQPLSVAVVHASLAEALIATRQIDEAAALAKGAVAVLQTGMGEHQYPWDAARAFAHALIELGELDEAESRLRACVAAFNALPLSLTEMQLQVGRAKSALGKCLTRMGRYQEAERMLLSAHAMLTAACGERHGYVRTARRRLAALYGAWSRPGDAERWRPAIDTATMPGFP